MKKIILYLMWIVILASFVFANGVCELDKENYDAGETALFSCSCTVGGEQNQDGFIVWKKSDGTILRSIADNSGTCISSFFGDSFLFTEDGFSGNTSFADNADGTGAPPGWRNIASDKPWDNFTVVPADPSDCFLTFENMTGVTFDLGRTFSLSVGVFDSVNNNSLTHANCHIHFLENNGINGGKNIFQEPYTPPGDTSIETGAFGEVAFQHLLNERLWEPFTTYKLEANCYCTPTNTTEQCWGGNSTTAISAGFKTCQAETMFTTGEDLRTLSGSNNMLPIIVSLVCLIAYLALVSFVNFKLDKNTISFWASLVSGSLAIIELFLMIGVIYINELGGLLSGILRINFWLMLILGTGVGMITLFIVISKLMNLDPEEKW